MRLRPRATSRSTLVLGAGACTEIPLAALCRTSDTVVLADLDLAAMQRGCEVLTFPAQRRQAQLVQADLTGEVSVHLARLLKLQPWRELVAQGAQAVFDAAAHCLEQCPVPNPPEFVEHLLPGEFGVVISSLVLSQLFSYPILDVLERIQTLAPSLLGEQERHRRYQEAAQGFRLRIIHAHLHLLRSLIDVGGIVVLLSDIRGFVFTVHGTDHDASHRRSIPLVPRMLPELVAQHFSIIEEQKWEWLTDLPEKERPGRGYEVVGYVLKASE